MAVERALRMVEEIMGISVSKLRPTDRFDRELVPEKGWEFDDEILDLGWLLESTIQGSSKSVATVGDFVKVIARRE